MSNPVSTRFASVSSDMRLQTPSSPTPGAAPKIRARRSGGLPRAFRDMIATEPLFEAHLEGRLSQLERRMQQREGQTPNLMQGTPEMAMTLSAPPDARRHTPNGDKLKARIRRLERSKVQLREKLQDTKEALKDARREADLAQTELLRVEDTAAMLARAEEKVKRLQRSIASLQQESSKFRRWWLTDYYSLRVVLELVPNPEDVEAIVSSSQARFASYSQ